jgi:predicted SAM-dependent methyltransferase
MSLKLVVGAKATEYPGWVSTDLRADAAPPLDIRVESDWLRRFAPGSIDRIVCDHVLEHMTVPDARSALLNFKKFLRPGGFARIAVPDALNPDPRYQEMCRPGGSGEWLRRNVWYAPDEPGHVEHYDYKRLTALVASAGLIPELREWFDERGAFHVRPWDVGVAPVKRYRGSSYNQFFVWWMGYENLSVIVDAVKKL